MNPRYLFQAVSFGRSGQVFSDNSNISPRYYYREVEEEEEEEGDGARHRPVVSSRSRNPSLMTRMAMRASRARWFVFLRRVFYYQNSTNVESDHNPFNSRIWMMLEFMALFVQICATSFTLGISEEERPIWPLRIWIVGYNVGLLLSLLLVYGRYRQLHVTLGEALRLPDLEEQGNSGESRYLQLMNKCRSSLDLFFAIWFVMGNVWIFDSRFSSFKRAPKLHMLCVALLSWNALSYAFPFMLFLFLCCCVPLISNFLGYNMNMGSIGRGATDDQISCLPSWRYKATTATNGVHTGTYISNADLANSSVECCICLATYKDGEEMRQLPCNHMFHLDCIDQWLRIMSYCPLCKQDL